VVNNFNGGVRLKIGYVRVSTVEQNTIRQEVLMRELGVDKVYIDKASGKNTERWQLQNMLRTIQAGDTVIVESYSRIARSTRDLLDIVEVLKKQGVEFISKKESIDTGTPAGRLMLTIFAGLYQFERECLLERQAEGIAEAKKAGKYKGRKPIGVDVGLFKMLYKLVQDNKMTNEDAAENLGLSMATYWRRINAFKGGRPPFAGMQDELQD
jgi:DNA invertase Pin-like site-specific DNA recombinase